MICTWDDCQWGYTCAENLELSQDEMKSENAIAEVISVSTGGISVAITSSSAMSSLAVGGLCSIHDEPSQSRIIAIVDSIRGRATDSDSTSDANHGYALAQLTILGQLREGQIGTKSSFKRGSDAFPPLGAKCYELSGNELNELLVSVTATYRNEELFELGTYTLSKTARACASGSRFFQRHAAVVGSTGSGKSWTVALLLERASQLKGANIILFDLHGEYGPLSDPETGFAKRLRLAGPGDLDNPADDVLFLPYWLLSRDEMFSVVADIRQESAYNQASRFARHIFDLKEEWRDKNGLNSELRSITLDSPIPYELEALIARLDHDDTEMVEGSRGEKKGPWNGALTKVLERLTARTADKRNGFLFQAPTDSMSPEWLNGMVSQMMCADENHPGIKIIDFSEVPSDLLAVATSTIARLLYTVQFWMDPTKRSPICLICDEAHLYLPRADNADSGQSRALETFERIAKEGRKYGVSLLVVSQRPSDVSATILSQCNNFLSLRLTNDRDQSAVRNLLPDTMKGISDILPILDTGEALLIGDAVMLPTRIRLDKPIIAPTSATMDFWVEWQKQSASPEVMAAAISNLRRQSRQRN